MTTRRVAGAVLSLLLFAPAVRAQTTESAATGPRIQPFFGFALGVGIVPRAFEANCIDGWDGHATSGAIQLRLGAHRGRFSLESRTTPQAEVGLSGAADCLYEMPVRDDGTHVQRESPIGRGPFIMSDIRANFALKQRPITWLVSGGVGWVWSRSVPTIVFGSGIRWGRDLRGVIDAEWTTYHLPFERVTEEWRDQEVVSRIADSRQALWQSGVAIRIGVEVVLQR